VTAFCDARLCFFRAFPIGAVYRMNGCLRTMLGTDVFPAHQIPRESAERFYGALGRHSASDLRQYYQQQPSF
jgi:hypothetical protein